MDGCISYPSSGSIRVSMISMPSNSFSYLTSCPPRQRQRNKNNKKNKNTNKTKRKKKRMMVLGLFSSSNATTRQVDEGIRMQGHERSFPYEYIDRLDRLNDTALPSKEAFLSRLKKEGIPDEDCASCHEAWCEKGMFKQGIIVPGLNLLYLFNDLQEKTYFTIFQRRPTLPSSTRRIKIFITSSKITWLAELRSFFTAITRNESTCEFAVLVVTHARHANGMVHATTGRCRLPSRIGGAVRTDGCGMIDFLRHQINSREKRIGKHLVDG